MNTITNCKEFSLNRIHPDDAVSWLKKAESLNSKIIVVGHTGGHLKPNYLLPDGNLEEKIAQVKNDSDYYAGVVDVDKVLANTKNSKPVS
jgi:hypothetical protein